MKPKKRQKLCSNCDGEIDLDVIVCPYCAADLREEKPEQQRTAHIAGQVRPLSGGQMSESLYPPSFGVQPTKENPVPSEAALSEAAPALEDRPHRTIGSILLLGLGVQLLLLGFLLVLLSHHGVVTLRWDARVWFLYIFAAIPFLVFGYRSLVKL
jgi:hypothetical protein